MSTTRRHPKSRTGCFQCKQRKVKCDEHKPSCANCVRHKSSCSYLQHIPLTPRRRHGNRRILPTPSNAPKSIQLSQNLRQTPTRGFDSLPFQFTTLDLELFHFYISKTSNELLGYHLTGTHIWQTGVVTLSLKHIFLLHELFSLAALHLAFVNASNPVLNQKYRNAAIFYYTKSIAQLRYEIENITRENYEACCFCSVLLGLHAWMIQDGRGANLFFCTEEKSDRGLGARIPWYKLHRGANEVLKSGAYWTRGGLMWESIRPWMSVSLSNPTPLKDEEKTNLDALAACWTCSDISSEDKIALEETLQSLRLMFSMISMAKVEISNSTVVLSWTTLIPSKFCQMVEERIPQALVLVAVYCILLKRLKELWWIRGKAEDLLEAVRRKVPDKSWDKWLEWPLKEVQGKRKDCEIEGSQNALSGIEKETGKI
ncbi:MAG: hypothetical protein M1834_003160 [Cirrosporium novae-zelandiae]|nr:MAG: hypothetical protein M1834_003160 [Cirrosporium novae-zelandiae]